MTRTTSVSPITVNVDVSLTMPMNIEPMFGIAIFVACGSVTEPNTRIGCMPHARPASRCPRGTASNAERYISAMNAL